MKEGVRAPAGGSAGREHGRPASSSQRCDAYLKAGGLCREVKDGIGPISSVGRGDFEPSRRRGVWRLPRLSAVGRHDQVACGRHSKLAGRLLSWNQWPDGRAPRDRAQFPCHPHTSITLNESRSILVCRLKSEQSRAGVLEAAWSFTASTTRKRVFGGASRPSSPVRHRSCVDRLPSHAADLALCARMAGPFSRLPPILPLPTLLLLW